jgi:hypothetical protein
MIIDRHQPDLMGGKFDYWLLFGGGHVYPNVSVYHLGGKSPRSPIHHPLCDGFVESISTKVHCVVAQCL